MSKAKLNKCKNCNGTGAVPFEDTEIQSCPDCNGSGLSVKKENKDEDSAPIKE